MSPSIAQSATAAAPSPTATPVSARCVAVVSAARSLAFSPCSMARSSIVSAQVNSSARIASPMGITRNAGPGRTSIANPASSTMKPTIT